MTPYRMEQLRGIKTSDGPRGVMQNTFADMTLEVLISKGKEINKSILKISTDIAAMPKIKRKKRGLS